MKLESSYIAKGEHDSDELAELQLEILLDIRDLLVEARDQRKEVVVDFVPPDYGKESEL